MRSESTRTASAAAKKSLQISEELTFWEGICKATKAHGCARFWTTVTTHGFAPLPTCDPLTCLRLTTDETKLANLSGRETFGRCCGGARNTTDVAYRRPHSADQSFSCRAPCRPGNSVNNMSIDSRTLLTKHQSGQLGSEPRATPPRHLPINTCDSPAISRSECSERSTQGTAGAETGTWRCPCKCSWSTLISNIRHLCPANAAREDHLDSL